MLQRDPGRKAAVTVNAAMALLATLKVSANETAAYRGDVRNTAVERVLDEMTKVDFTNAHVLNFFDRHLAGLDTAS